jgi:hypothetical protein
MPRPSSSFYSQDDRVPNKLGYTPFEYWKGPKPVVWPSTRQAPHTYTHGRKHSSGSRAAARISARAHPGGAVNSLRQFEPIQPSKLYSAQQFVASLQAAKLVDTKHGNGYGQDIKLPAGPWDGADEKSRLKKLAAIDESSGDYKTPGGVRIAHKEILSRSHSTRSSPPDYADLPPLNMSKKGSRNPPPGYYHDDGRPDRWWDPKTWRRRTWAILVAVVVVIIIIIVIVVTLLQKTNAYPNYKRLVYTLSDEYSGSELSVPISVADATQHLGSRSARAAVFVARHHHLAG